MLLPCLRHDSFSSHWQSHVLSIWPWVVCEHKLPQLSVFFFCWYFNHSRFVDDTCRPVALFHNPDDPCLVTFLLLYVLTKSRSLFAWQRYQQPTWNLQQLWFKLYTSMLNWHQKIVTCQRLLLNHIICCFNLPEVSAEWPCNKPNMFPHALLTAAIFAMIGKLWITKPTSFFCTRARLVAWPSNPKPVTSVAPCALYLCINLAAKKQNKTCLEQY